jgi:hypothetical protein
MQATSRGELLKDGSINVAKTERSMSTLTYTNSTFAPVAPVAEKAPRKLWRRVFDALIESQQRRADREIARFLASNGGLLTDDAEREMMRRLMRSDRRAV